ncbi:MAG: Plug domain-containing protein, partial [Bacteroidales bacterium]|nr:Plug domain-containing protein [Bacteroidales bacterium]
MKRFFLCLVVACTTFNTVFSARTNSSHAEALAANDSIKTFHLNDVLVIGNRAGSQTPVAQTNLEAKAIKELTVANNLPYVLWMTPSLVTTSENGTGAGNSSFRIRGTDATRINVTLNGVPLNNPEEQEVYYVDIPDMTSALQSIQVQRGVG